MHILETFGDQDITYTEEVSPYEEFSDQQFSTRSPDPKIDIVARRGGLTVALVSSRWRYRHDRVNLVGEAMAYAHADTTKTLGAASIRGSRVVPQPPRKGAEPLSPGTTLGYPSRHPPFRAASHCARPRGKMAA